MALEQHLQRTQPDVVGFSVPFPGNLFASLKIGQYLKFNVLDYNIGYNKEGTQKIGCLSKSMVLNSENKLTEGKVYLTGHKSSYNPEKDKKQYTFQFIKKTLSFFSRK